jgi:Bifunctional DNA primase/polymerase, N-terminal/Primase C terminal 1 (PriCT-1)
MTDEGIFGGMQPVYAEHGLATFPVTEDKQPAIKGYLKLGLRGSGELATKTHLADASALGIVCGKKITLVDIDTSDERVLIKSLEEYGETPIISRTPSGGYHQWYRANGEPRKIRPQRDIDILGRGGFAIVPPSRVAKGKYEFIEGGLDDLGQLPTMRWQPKSNLDSPLRGMREHDGRNDALFKAIGPVARNVHYRGGNREELFECAMRLNSECEHPMEVSEVEQIVESSWGITVEGRNYVSRPGAFIDASDFMTFMTPENQDAFILYQFLRIHQGLDAAFMCTNGLTDKFKWSVKRLAAARSQLIELGYMKQVRQAGRGHPALFRWERRKCI